MKLFRRLDYAERWMRDGLSACRVPAYFESAEVDMSKAADLIETARSQGIRLTYAHVFVRAAALVLAANPDLHRMVCGTREYAPRQVDVALSIAGEAAVAPLLVVEGADRKELPAIAKEILTRAPGVREADRKMLAQLRRWGWVLPFAFLRRLLLGLLFRSYQFRVKGSGTFQVSVLPHVDQAGTSTFSTTAMLVAGAVKERVVAVNGHPAVRLTVILTCCADHRIWDGRAGQRFLESMRGMLESSALREELEFSWAHTDSTISVAGSS